MPLRFIFRLAAVLICFGLLLFAIHYFYFYYQERPEVNVSLPQLSIIPGQTRVLVVAPHCDDETLGCAGIMQEVLGAGGQVMVAAMTNGDGFTFAAKGQFHRLFINNFDYIQSGYTRQKELLRALNRLGVAEEKVVFLSYPDRGLRDLWLDHWDSSTPYQSRYTGRDHSPYYNSYRPDAIYAGETVTADLEQILRDFKPTVILSPHPADEHPDHSTTWAFIAATSIMAGNGGISPRPQLYTYLIHRGDFPIPHGYKPEADLLPPRPLYQSHPQRWSVYPLTPEKTAIKEKALNEYVSQLRIPIMSGLLHSFIRKNELFEEVVIPVATRKSVEVDLTELNAWAGQEPVLVHSKGVSSIGALERRAKVESIASIVQDTAIWLHFSIPNFSKKNNQYQISLIDFRLQPTKIERERREFYFSENDTDVSQDDIVRYLDDVIVKIPYCERGLPKCFFIQVLTKDNFGTLIDHTEWQPVMI